MGKNYPKTQKKTTQLKRLQPKKHTAVIRVNKNAPQRKDAGQPRGNTIKGTVSKLVVGLDFGTTHSGEEDFEYST